jgi:hypothetical protein
MTAGNGQRHAGLRSTEIGDQQSPVFVLPPMHDDYLLFFEALHLHVVCLDRIERNNLFSETDQLAIEFE